MTNLGKFIYDNVLHIVSNLEKLMININVTYNDDLGDKLKAAKEASGENWHDFILLKAGIVTKRELRKMKEEEKKKI